MGRNKQTNPHALPGRGKNFSRNDQKLPPLNTYIRTRIAELKYTDRDIREKLKLSRAQSYRVMNGFFPPDYHTRVALAKLLMVDLATLVLWEHGLLNRSEWPKVKVPKRVTNTVKEIKSLLAREGISSNQLRGLISP